MTLRRELCREVVELLPLRFKRILATELLDLTIKLDHSGEYPFEQIKRLHGLFAKNRFCDRVLKDLVIANMQTFDIGREMRQRVTGLLNVGSPGDAALSRGTKRLSS